MNLIKQFLDNLSQKEKTLKQLYCHIYHNGPISKNAIITSTGLKQTTCSRLIDELLEYNLIIESGFGESSGGRKPLLYEIKPDAYHVIGIDISRTYTKVLLMDMSLSVKEENRLTMNSQTTPDVTIDFIKTTISTMLDSHKLQSREILGVGLGLIGPIDRERGMILNPIQFPSPGWKDISIGDKLSDTLNMKVVIDNGANTALLAEYQNELFKSYKNVVYVIKGIGTRTGIIMDGRLVHLTDKLGPYGNGHMIVDLHGRKCVCGSYGCVHAYSSILAIKKDIINALKEGKDSIIRDRVDDIENIDFEDICWAVNANDPVCCQVIKDAAYYTGIGLSNLINVLFPDLIILSGPMYTKMDLFYETVMETANKRCAVIYPEHSIDFHRSTLGENAIAIGAGKMILDEYLTS